MSCMEVLRFAWQRRLFCPGQTWGSLNLKLTPLESSELLSCRMNVVAAQPAPDSIDGLGCRQFALKAKLGLILLESKGHDQDRQGVSAGYVALCCSPGGGNVTEDEYEPD